VAASRIIISARRNNQELMPDLAPPAGDSDFYFVAADDPDTAVALILELAKTRIRRRIGLDPIRDIQVLADQPRSCRGALAQHRASGRSQPRRRREGRTLRLDLRSRGQRHADRERLRQGGTATSAMSAT
jgi:hypothetical protein